VETADGQILEQATRNAVTNFVIGCKADGIWTAIKASCILAGARTLTGALVPLVGIAPTNVNFASGDYNRKTGLVGNGSTKYLNSNRNNNADPQNSKHLALYISSLAAEDVYLMDAGEAGAVGRSQMIGTTSQSINYAVTSATRTTGTTENVATSFAGINRSTASTQVLRFGGVTQSANVTSLSPTSRNIVLYAGSIVLNAQSSSRLAFYSIGESLDLALLDARVTTLVNAFAAAIP